MHVIHVMALYDEFDKVHIVLIVSIIHSGPLGQDQRQPFGKLDRSFIGIHAVYMNDLKCIPYTIDKHK